MKVYCPQNKIRGDAEAEKNVIEHKQKARTKK